MTFINKVIIVWDNVSLSHYFYRRETSLCLGRLTCSGFCNVRFGLSHNFKKEMCSSRPVFNQGSLFCTAFV